MLFLRGVHGNGGRHLWPARRRLTNQWRFGRAVFGALAEAYLVILAENADFPAPRHLQSPNPHNLSRHDSYTAQEQSEWELRRWDGSFDIATTS